MTRGKVVVITGASGYIGACLTHKLTSNRLISSIIGFDTKPFSTPTPKFSMNQHQLSPEFSDLLFKNKAETLTSAMAEQIKSIAKNTYGYDAGVINGATFPETHEEYNVKIDAVINDANRAILNYSKTESYYPRKYNGGATVFSNNYYAKPPVIERSSIELYSNVTDRLSTKLKFSRYEMDENDASIGDGLFPEVNIEVGGDNVYLGGDRYRGANHIMVDEDFLIFKADYDNDETVLTFGIEKADTSVYNLFIARYNGEIHFDSIADFETGRGSFLRFHTPISG